MHQRFTSLPGFGEEELDRLENATAAVVGLGATGSVIAEHLARHGVELLLVDRDYLEEKDLYTSNLYSREQVERGLPKAEAAAEQLSGVTEAESRVESLDGSNVSMLEEADVILDGTDNMEARFLLDEHSRESRTPWIYTAAIAGRGVSMLFDGECFSCVFDDVKPGTLETCETAGIMREASTIAGSMSAWKAVRYLSGKEVEETLDTVSGDSLEVDSEGCEVCEGGEYERLGSRGETAKVCGEDKYQLHRDVDEPAFERLREAGEVVADNDYLLRVEVDGGSVAVFHDGRAIVEARDRGHAEARLDELLGR